MAHDKGGQAESRGRVRRKRRKRNSQGRDKLISNLKWGLGGIALGLPVLAFFIYVVSNV